MTQETVTEQVESIRKQAMEAVQAVKDRSGVERIRVAFLGKKGEITQLLRGVGRLSGEERPLMGRLINELRDELTEAIAVRTEEVHKIELEDRLKSEAIDVTLPGKRIPVGGPHPLTRVLNDIQDVFIGLGFEVVEGPEIETEYYNFEALNVPANHPARDMQDTFYITPGMLLRSQTSPVQIRTMESREPPVRVIAPGKVYRVDSDATHSPMFHQIEGLLIDRTITFGDLKGTLEMVAKALFGHDRGVRFRPSYFPFTEPSAEMDITCALCAGQGCRFCSHEGWIEILGAGMVHPNVLKMVGYDPEEVGGFAFGMGLERIALLKYGIEDIRLLFESDMRFLRQFIKG